MKWTKVTFPFVLLSGLCFPAPGQSSRDKAGEGSLCGVPSPSGFENEPNIFSEQQEEWLGEILASDVEKSFNIIRDPEGDYLQRLGQRLLAQLPPSKIHYSFTIIDLPGFDSFGIPGGHIYFSRKILALARNEDELVGLIGHEIGHIITRQPALDLTREFQTVLGISQLGDRQDIFEKWNRWLDTRKTKAYKHSEKREDEEQIVADRIALYAMARAGYQPSHFVDFYDRLAQTKGNKGTFWTDLFGRTSRDSKRLRELLRSAAPLGQSCVAPLANGAPEDFLKWQNAVISSTFAATKESLPGLISKGALNPPLRSDLRSLEFSPDGNYLLAQDESSVFVMTSNPTTLLVNIDAPDSYLAHFTPDSRGVVFRDKEYRVQKWDVETKNRVSIHAVVLVTPCVQTALSPSGEVMACVTAHFDIMLIEVKSSAVIFQTKHPREPTWAELWAWYLDLSNGEWPEFVVMQFSPDNKYFIAAHGGTLFAYDLQAKSEVSLPRQIKNLIHGTFTFLSPEEIATFDLRTLSPTIVRAKFPSGDVLDTLPRPPALGHLMAPAKGDYILVGLTAESGIALLDWKKKKSLLRSKTPAFAVYGDMFANETRGGEIGVYKLADQSYQGGLDLPNGPLGSTTAAVFSPDGKWLAVSEKSRGAVWKLETGERTFLTRGFDGAFFDKDQLFAKFPKQGKEEATVFKMDPGSKSLETAYNLSPEVQQGEAPSFTQTWQLGEILVKTKWQSNKKANAAMAMEAFDVRTNQKLWQRDLQSRRPALFYSRSGRTLTVVVADYKDMKAEAKQYQDLSAQLSELGNETRRAASYIVEVLDSSTGKDVGRVLVDTGNLSFKVLAAMAVGDTVLVSDSVDRTLVYSLRKGVRTGKVFGYARAVSADGSRMLVENGRGNVDLYDVANVESLAHFAFPSRIAHAEFSADQSSIMVLTVDQAVYRVKLPAPDNAVSR